MSASPSPVPPPRTRSRAPLWRALASFTVIGLALLAALSLSPRLGLDLEGGTQIVLETRDSPRVKADRDSTDRALEVLRGRVDALGVAEPTLARAGEKRIIVELPGVQDPREAARGDRPDRAARFPRRARARPRRGAGAGGHDEGVRRGRASRSSSARRCWTATACGTPRPSCPRTASARGSSRWPSTGRAHRSGGSSSTVPARTRPGGRRIAILLDREVISSPAVQPELCSGAGSATQITGQFTQRSAEDLAILIKGGALPVPVEVDRAAHRRRHPRRRRDRRVGRGRDRRHRADRAVHRAWSTG